MAPRSIFLVLALALVFPSANAADEDGFNEHTIRKSDLPANPPRFEQFPTSEKFGGRIVPPDLNSYAGAKMFRTAIRRGTKDGPNFAGHFTVVGWGCGAGCETVAIVDANTGKIYVSDDLASIDNTNVDYNGLEGADGRLIQYRKDSRLLTVIGGINEDPKLRGISYFVWEHNRFKRIRFVAKPNE